jgi:hypothetical protein
MHPKLREAYEAALRQGRTALAAGELDAAFAHFERAHVLGQWYVRAHTLAHVGMLRVGWRRRDLGEIAGQLFRIPGGALGSALGRVPRGNTGGANVSALREMPIPPELEDILRLDKRSRLG